jgi:single-strand DNA-binding protein
MLIGNLTRDPELRYTPSGAAVCTFGVATNRYYVASDGNKKEETEFIKIVSWNKLAELCSQLLSKGRKVYVEGRLQTRSWETPDGQTKQTTEVVIDDMRILDSRRDFEGAGEDEVLAAAPASDVELVEPDSAKVSKEEEGAKKASKSKATKKEPTSEKKKEDDEEKVDLDDLPF